MFLNLYSVGPMIIVRAPEGGVPWKKLMGAAGRILHHHGLRSKDLLSVDREGLDDVGKLESAFSGSAEFPSFLLYDFDVESGEFTLVRGAVAQ